MKFKELDIVGIGIGGMDNTTILSKRLIQNADVVFTLVNSIETRDSIKLLNVKLIDLLGYYNKKDKPSIIYRNMANAIIMDREPWIKGCFVVDGNPQFYNIPVKLLRKYGMDNENWTTRIHPAVSSIDTMLIDLNIHSEEKGLQLMDAPRSLINQSVINPRLELLLIQIAACSTGTFISVKEQEPIHFKTLQDWLLKYYSKNHPFIIVRSRTSFQGNSKMINTTVGEFIDYAKDIDYHCSAYIKPQ